MGKSRDYIPANTLLAAALLQIPVDQGDGTFGPIMTHEESKLVGPDDVIRLFHRDHYPRRKNDGGLDVHYNIVWRPRPGHLRKTAKIDIPEIAKTKKVAARHLEFRRRMLEKSGRISEAPQGRPLRPKRKIPSRPFAKGHRPINWRKAKT